MVAFCKSMKPSLCKFINHTYLLCLLIRQCYFQLLAKTTQRKLTAETVDINNSNFVKFVTIKFHLLVYLFILST